MRKIVALAALALLAFAGSAAAQGQPAPGPLQGNIAFNTKSVGFILGVAGYAWHDTRQVATTAMALFADEASTPRHARGFHVR